MMDIIIEWEKMNVIEVLMFFVIPRLKPVLGAPVCESVGHEYSSTRMHESPYHLFFGAFSLIDEPPYSEIKCPNIGISITLLQMWPIFSPNSRTNYIWMSLTCESWTFGACRANVKWLFGTRPYLLSKAAVSTFSCRADVICPVFLKHSEKIGALKTLDS